MRFKFDNQYPVFISHKNEVILSNGAKMKPLGTYASRIPRHAKFRSRRSR